MALLRQQMTFVHELFDSGGSQGPTGGGLPQNSGALQHAQGSSGNTASLIMLPHGSLAAVALRRSEHLFTGVAPPSFP
jgi:hypothetical protein